MDDAVIFTDADERIEYVNPAWEKMNGFSQAEVLGKNPAILKDRQNPRVHNIVSSNESSTRGSPGRVS